jgi:hypothetical protein
MTTFKITLEWRGLRERYPEVVSSKFDVFSWFYLKGSMNWGFWLTIFGVMFYCGSGKVGSIR